MNSVLKIKEDSIKKDGLVKTAVWNYNQPLYNKNLELTIPNFCIQISNTSMINIIDMRIELDHLLKKHSKLYLIKIFDVDSQLLNDVRNTQINFDGGYIAEAKRHFFYNNLMILDFASESFYFTKHLKKLSECKRFPKEVLDVAKKLQKHTTKISNYANYRDNNLEIFWKNILKDERSLLDFESKIHKQGIALYGDIILPFTKLIRTTKQDVLDVEKINIAWMHWNRVEEKPTVAYIPISMASLKKESVVDEICDYITRLKSDILVMKVKNIHLTDPSKNIKQRELFGNICLTIAKKKQQNENLLAIFLEAGDHIYPLSIQAFDIVSASANLFDEETNSGGRAPDGYGGKAIDEETLALLGFDDWQKAFDKMGTFPCTHEFCRNHIKSMNKSNYTQWQWYIDLRKHNILALTDWMKMIGESVQNQMADLAINRLRNSPYAILNELLVRNYDDSIEYLQ